MSRDRPDRPGVAAFAAELDVDRNARTALAVAIGFSALVFLRYAYLPGTDEPVVYWLGLSFVLAFAVFVLVLVGLVARTAYRQTREDLPTDGGGLSPPTIAFVVGLVGWIAAPILIAIGTGTESTSLAGHNFVLLVQGCFGAILVGSVGVHVAAALSIHHRWYPGDAAIASIAYSAVVFTPSVGGPIPRLGTPHELLAPLLGTGIAIDPLYAVSVLGGGFAIGAILSFRGIPASHSIVAGTVAAVAVLPIVAATAADPNVVRTSSIYLPIVLGSVGILGAGGLRMGRAFTPGLRDERDR